MACIYILRPRHGPHFLNQQAKCDIIKHSSADSLYDAIFQYSLFIALKLNSLVFPCLFIRIRQRSSLLRSDRSSRFFVTRFNVPNQKSQGIKHSLDTDSIPGGCPAFLKSFVCKVLTASPDVLICVMLFAGETLCFATNCGSTPLGSSVPEIKIGKWATLKFVHLHNSFRSGE